jgi:hypothetical protein
MPAQSIVVADAYGSYTPATRLDLIYTGGPQYVVGLSNPIFNPAEYATRSQPVPAGTSAGQLAGRFECHPFFYGCLGATRITYTLPFEIVGLAGMLDLYVPNGQFSDVGFFEFPNLSLSPDGHPFRYTGFWATTFAPTNTLTINWRPMDGFSNFTLSDAQVVRAVRVPEPATLMLLGTALLGLLAVRRKPA